MCVCVERGRCCRVTLSTGFLQDDAGHTEEHKWPAPAAAASPCVLLHVYTHACYEGCLHAGHMIGQGTDA